MKFVAFAGCVVAVAFSLCADNVSAVRVLAGGSVRLPGRTEAFVPFARTGNWRINTVPVGTLKGAASEDSMPSRLAANHTVYADGEVAVRRVPNGGLRVSCRYECQKGMSDSMWGMRLKLPADSFIGCRWGFGEKKGMFPKKKGSKGARASGRLLELGMPDGESYRLKFDLPVVMEWIDNRNWGSDAFIVSFGGLEPHPVLKGEVCELSFTLSSETELRVEFEKPCSPVAGKEWVPVDYVKNIIPGSALDFSGLSGSSGRAGRYGWLKNADGHFEFEKLPGKRQRFYGVNLCSDANYPDKALADEVVERFMRLGYNSMRFHHHDGAWRGKKDLFDYFMSRAIEKGLYITTDLYVSRRVRWDALGVDRKGEVPMGMYKAMCLFHEPTYNDFMAYVREFMEHVNPYTGRRYADEPGMPFISIINEGALDGVWSSLKSDPLFADEWKRWSAKNPKGGMLDYMTDRERTFMERFRKFWKEDLKAKAMLSNQNRGPYSEALNQVKREYYDYVDRHFYRGHPKFPLKSWRLPATVGHGNPLGDRKFFLSGLSEARVAELPFAVSEWNCGAPSSFRSLGALAFGAVAASERWDAAWRFAYSHRAEKMREGRHQMSYFDLSTDPLNQASDRAALALFLRGDGDEPSASMKVDPAKASIVVTTPRTCGFHAKEGEVQAGPLRCSIYGTPTTAFAVSLDGKRIDVSRRVLFTHLTDVQADGSVFSDSTRTLLYDWGKGGCVAHDGKVKVRLSIAKPERCTVYALGTDGSRKCRIKSRIEDGALLFTATVRQPFGACFHYEIASSD